ncbi:phosphoenolpyruvate kinase [bacterium]|nr:phosphoenolpyruvate kinase [bacterium]
MDMEISSNDLADVFEGLSEASRASAEHYPGEPNCRQPVHTLFGGAHLFRADTARRLGQLALRAVEEHAPDCTSLARAVGMVESNELPDGIDLSRFLANDSTELRAETPDLWLARAVYDRVLAKLRREPVEDYRIDFEDGFGIRSDAEEDAVAISAANEVAQGLLTRLLPPFLGIRIKPLTDEFKFRAARTAQIFVATVLNRTGGVLPPEFVITLPKVTIAEQVVAMDKLLTLIESTYQLKHGTIKLELMVESTQAFLGPDGRSPLPALLFSITPGRCRGIHFGVYDYSASAEITASHQSLDHRACDFARQMLKVSYARTGVFLSDGPTTLIPVGTTPAVHRAWKLSYANIRRALVDGFYQGYDLHPAQLPVRFAACYAFFLQGAADASRRLNNFVRSETRVAMSDGVFDDAATAQGLLNFFRRGIHCGALTQDELSATGLSPKDFREVSITRIMKNRRTT